MRNLLVSSLPTHRAPPEWVQVCVPVKLPERLVANVQVNGLNLLRRMGVRFVLTTDAEGCAEELDITAALADAARVGHVADLIARRRHVLAGGGDRLVSVRALAVDAERRTGIPLSPSFIDRATRAAPRRSWDPDTRTALAGALRVDVKVVNRAIAADLGLDVDILGDNDVAVLVSRFSQAEVVDRTRVLSALEAMLPEPIVFARAAGVPVLFDDGPVETGPPGDRYTLTGEEADRERAKVTRLPTQGRPEPLQRPERAAARKRPRTSPEPGTQEQVDP